MKAAEHLARAEELLAGPDNAADGAYEMIDVAMSLNALAHAVIAVGIELGVPHAVAAGPGADGG